MSDPRYAPQGGSPYPPQQGQSPYPPQQAPYGQPGQPPYNEQYPQHQQQGQYPQQYPPQQPPYQGHQGPPGSEGPPEFREDGPPGAEGERGLGTIALGAATGGFVGHKAGHHGLLGAIGGALTAGVVDHFRSKSKERHGRRDDGDDLAYGDGRHSGYGGGSSYAPSSAGGSLHPDDSRHGRHRHHHHHGSSSSHSRHRSRGLDGEDGDYQDDRYGDDDRRSGYGDDRRSGYGDDRRDDHDHRRRTDDY